MEQLIEEALLPKDNANTEFEKDQLFGYYTAISGLLGLAEGFGLDNSLPEWLYEFNADTMLEGL